MKALSLRQPWAWAVTHAGKIIENRRWRTTFRGEFLIHAALGMEVDEYAEAKDAIEDVCGIASGIEVPPMAELLRGGLVGLSNLVDVVPPRPEFMLGGVERHYPPYPCEDDFQWRWHMREQYGFVLEHTTAIPFVPMRGMPGFFEVPEDIVQRAFRSWMMGSPS